MISHIKLVNIPVKDQQRALDFYTEKLGFSVKTDASFGDQRWIELATPDGETRVVLFTLEEYAGLIGKFQNIVFATDDVHKSYDELSEKGVEFVKGPTEEHWGIYAMFKDSEGNQFVLSSSSE